MDKPRLIAVLLIEFIAAVTAAVFVFCEFGNISYCDQELKRNVTTHRIDTSEVLAKDYTDLKAGTSLYVYSYTYDGFVNTSTLGPDYAHIPVDCLERHDEIMSSLNEEATLLKAYKQYHYKRITVIVAVFFLISIIVNALA